jgi:hypothetical protein
MKVKIPHFMIAPVDKIGKRISKATYDKHFKPEPKPKAKAETKTEQED